MSKKELIEALEYAWRIIYINNESNGGKSKEPLRHIQEVLDKAARE